MTPLSIALVFAASFIAGIANAVAGGGSFFTFPALLLTGLDPRAANMTSTIMLFPMQVSNGYAIRKQATGTPDLSLKAMTIISLIGGVVGALLLTITPSSFFEKLVPWLILVATALFAYGSFAKPKKADAQHKLGRLGTILSQCVISIYGGYFGAGIGILMLAALTLAGLGIRSAGATKNILAAVINVSAVVIFMVSPDIGWTQVVIGLAGSIGGGWLGIRILSKVNEKALRILIIGIGTVLTIAMFVRA